MPAGMEYCRTAAISVGDDPSPLALIVAATLRRAARHPKLAATIARTKGSVALRSSVDPQAATIRFEAGRAHVAAGAEAGAEVVIEADLTRMGEPGAPKPRVTGAFRHPRLALATSKLLEPPHGTWQDEATAFWSFASAHPGAPRGLRVVATDSGTEARFGAVPAEYEIHGPEHALLRLFTGGSVLGQELLDGKLHAVGSLRHLAELTGRSLAWAMGGS